MHHAGAALFIAKIVVGLLAPLHSPERNVASFWQVVAGVLAIEITNLILGDSDNHGGNVGIMDPAFLIFAAPLPILAALHPARRHLSRVGARMSRTMAGISLAAAIPLARYGVGQAFVQRNSWPPLADPHHQKWFMMAFLALALPLLGLLSSLKMAGWRVPAWSAGGAAVAFGLVAALSPDAPSSVGTKWGGRQHPGRGGVRRRRRVGGQARAGGRARA